MNSGKYNELIEKYYRGKTSLKEERWLKEHSYLQKETIPNLGLEKESINWSFDEFRNNIENATPVVKMGAIRKNGWMKYAAAAAVILVVSLVVLQKDHVSTNNIAKENSTGADTISTINHAPQTAQVSQQKLTPPAIPQAERPLVVTQKQKNKQKPQTTKTKKSTAGETTSPTETDGFFVMVNGKRITDEAAALEITQNSLATLGNKVKSSVEPLRNIPKIDLNLK